MYPYMSDNKKGDVSDLYEPTYTRTIQSLPDGDHGQCLFFTIAVTLCLQLFFQAHKLAEGSSVLHRAVTTCSSVAEVYQSTRNTDEAFLTAYPESIRLNQSILIYFNQDFTECSRYDAVYRVSVTFADTDVPSVDILFSRLSDEAEIYSLTVYSYLPAPISQTGGNSFE